MEKGERGCAVGGGSEDSEDSENSESSEISENSEELRGLRPHSLINNAKLRHKKGRRKSKSIGVKCCKEVRKVMALS